jgi:hypothetical protein
MPYFRETLYLPTSIPWVLKVNIFFYEVKTVKSTSTIIRNLLPRKVRFQEAK